MNALKLFKPLWWVLHAVAVPAVFWLGHFLQEALPRKWG